MDSGGHKAASGSAGAAANPSAMLSALMSKRAKLQDELLSIERQVYEMETTYLQESNQFGSVLKGFEGFLSSSKSTANLKRSRKFQADDRLFSLSSVTSPAVDEHLTGRDDGREYGPGRSKGGTPANGQCQNAARKGWSTQLALCPDSSGPTKITSSRHLQPSPRSMLTLRHHHFCGYFCSGENRRREGGLEEGKARDFGRRTIKIWTMKMISELAPHVELVPCLLHCSLSNC